MNSKKMRSLCCFMIGLTLLFYAIPRMPIGEAAQMGTGFSVIWVTFALLVIGANLHHALGLDYEEQRDHRRNQQEKLWRREFQKNRTRRMAPRRTRGLS